MNAVEMQATVLPTSFPISDTRPSQSTTYFDHDLHTPHYVDSRHSSKENKSPSTSIYKPASTPVSPQSVRLLENTSGVLTNGQVSPSSVAGKKRTANGEVKNINAEVPKAAQVGHTRTTSTVSNGSDITMTELGSETRPVRHSADIRQLSQQLRTRLTYAMVKVQNGWQNRSLDEVESLASASPRSTVLNHHSDNNHLLSPRVALTAHLQREGSHSSSDSDHSQQGQVRGHTSLMSPPSSKKGLAPPANIISRPAQQRRRLAPNMYVKTGIQPSARPPINHRTASQTAGMEADAVETLLFMASPNHSGHQSGQFSPVTSAPSVHHFPSQTSPLRNTFSAPTSPKRVAFTPGNEYAARYGRDKNSVIASIFDKLDEDGDTELDEALKLMDQHHAAKVAS